MAYTRWITNMHVLALPNRAKLKKICIRAQLAYTPGLSYSTYTVQFSTVQYSTIHDQTSTNWVEYCKWNPRDHWGHRRRVVTEGKAKVVAAVWGGRIYFLPCRASYTVLCISRFERIGWIQPFLPIWLRVKILWRQELDLTAAASAVGPYRKVLYKSDVIWTNKIYLRSHPIYT